MACSAGNSIFFSVKRIEDPIGLLPAKLILGINKVCTEYSHRNGLACLRGIAMQSTTSESETSEAND